MEPENTPVGKGETSTNPPIVGFHVSFPGSTSQHLFIIFSSFSVLIMYIQSHGCEVFFVFSSDWIFIPSPPKKNCNCHCQASTCLRCTWEHHLGSRFSIGDTHCITLWWIYFTTGNFRCIRCIYIYIYVYILNYHIIETYIYILYNVHASDIFIVGLTMKSSIQKQKHHNESS